jgi:hypothetical protein
MAAPPAGQALPCSFLVGSVRVAGTGKAIDAHVAARNADRGFDRSARTEGGKFSLAGVPPGRLEVTCSADGHATFTTRVEVPAVPDLVRCDIVLQPQCKLRVRALTPDGKPLLDALREAKLWYADPIAVASETPLPAVLPNANADKLKSDFGAARWTSNNSGDMRRRLTTDVAGELELTKPLPLHVGFCLANFVLETRLLAEAAEEITFVVPLDAIASRMCVVRGRVVDAETGLPIEAFVSVLPKTLSSSGRPVDADGRFLVESLPPGLLVLEARTEASHDGVKRELELVAGQQLEVGDVRLSRRAGVSGRVLDPKGQPVAAAVRAVVADYLITQQYPALPQPTRSDAQGSFRFDGMSRIRYVLVAEAAGAVGFTPIDVASSAPLPVEIRLRPATEVTLTWAAKSREYVTKRIVSHDGLAVWSDAAPSQVTVRLPPGAYTIEICRGRQPSKQPLVVGTQPQTVEVQVR